MTTSKNDDADDEADADVDLGLTSHLDDDGKPRIVERHLIVPPELAGLRLDHFVKTQITRLSRTKIQQIIETQLRRQDGYAPKPATSVAAGEHYIIRRPARPEPPCPRTFIVLHEDARWAEEGMVVSRGDIVLRSGGEEGVAVRSPLSGIVGPRCYLVPSCPCHVTTLRVVRSRQAVGRKPRHAGRGSVKLFRSSRHACPGASSSSRSGKY